MFFRDPFTYGGNGIVRVSGKCAGQEGDFLVISEVAHVYIDQKIEPIESPLCGLELFCSMSNISVLIPEGETDGVKDADRRIGSDT